MTALGVVTRPRRGGGPWASGGWLDAARALPSPNCDDRPDSVDVSLLVIHHISMPPARFCGDGVERLFTNRLDPAAHPAYAEVAAMRVSAHLFIRRRGELLQFVDCDRRAWHAGASCFEGRERCNDFSIGVELEGDGAHPFTKAQYRRLRQVVHWLLTRYRLRAMVGHSDIAPGRKSDPGPHFDWSRCRDALAGTGLSFPSLSSPPPSSPPRPG